MLKMTILHNNQKQFVPHSKSNPWQPTLPLNVGEVKKFKIQTGISQNCCKRVFLRIDPSYLTIWYGLLD